MKKLRHHRERCLKETYKGIYWKDMLCISLSTRMYPPCKRWYLSKLQFFRWGTILAVFWTSAKTLIHQCLPKSVLSRCSPTVAKWSWGQVTGFCWFHSPYWGLLAYYLMCMWTRLLLGSWVFGAESHSFHGGTFVHGWVPVIKRGTKRRDTLCHHDTDVTLVCEYKRLGKKGKHESR